MAVAAVSCVVTAALASLVYLSARHFLSFDAAAAALALVTVLTPCLPTEVLGASNNVHTFCLCCMPWLCLLRPRNWFQSVFTAICGGVIVLTEPQAILFAPLLLSHIRLPKRWPMVLTVVCAAVAQFLTATSASSRLTRPHTLSWRVDWQTYGPEVGVDAWLTQLRPLTELRNAGFFSVAWIALVPFAAALILVVTISFRDRRAHGRRGTHLLPALVAAIASFGLWCLVLYMNDATSWYLNVIKAELPNLGGRWSTAPTMFLWFLLVIAADQLLVSLRHARRPTALFLSLAAIAILAGSFPPAWNSVENQAMVDWSHGFPQAQAICRQGATYTTIFGSPSTALGPTAANWARPWPCSFILSRTSG
ncbi:MAG: hypothetical protein LBM66_01815 [Bifidobacteriaceae bacterium]|jgi:hypothetical protein|nr:hypothetical protein [Bifidobacteriaceae bacterium]